jgi:hypothetical protein
MSSLAGEFPSRPHTVAISRCSAPNRAAVLLLSLLERRPQRIIVLEASAERSAPMRLHIDRNRFDGNLIALAAITLLIAIVTVY